MSVISYFHDEWTSLRARGRNYGPEISTHDLIKALAVAIMIIDHVGYYLFPDQMWWRAIGRIGFPVWFFFAGFSRPGRSGLWLPLGAAFLVGVDVMFERPVFPLNALVTIFLIRAMVNHAGLMRPLDDWSVVLVAPFTAMLLYIYTNAMFEYGTLGLLFGVLGRIVRLLPDSPRRRAFSLLCFAEFIFLEQYFGEFSLPQYLLMATGTAAIMIWLYTFRTRVFASMGNWAGTSLIRFMGRHTLGIYVAHLTLLILLWAWLNPHEMQGFRLF